MVCLVEFFFYPNQWVGTQESPPIHEKTAHSIGKGAKEPTHTGWKPIQVKREPIQVEKGGIFSVQTLDSHVRPATLYHELFSIMPQLSFGILYLRYSSLGR